MGKIQQRKSIKILIWCSIILSLAVDVSAYCRQGEDGNWYTDETAEETFMNVDPTKGPMDFRLRPGSCAVNRGMTIPEVTHDFDGVRRPQGVAYDIGAFELKEGVQAPQHLEIK